MEGGKLSKAENLLPSSRMAKRGVSCDEKDVSCPANMKNSSSGEAQTLYQHSDEFQMKNRAPIQCATSTDPETTAMEQFTPGHQFSKTMYHIQRNYTQPRESIEHSSVTCSPSSNIQYAVPVPSDRTDTPASQEFSDRDIVGHLMPVTDHDRFSHPVETNEVYHSSDSTDGSSNRPFASSVSVYVGSSGTKRKWEDFHLKNAVDQHKSRKLSPLDDSYTTGYTSDESEEDGKHSTSSKLKLQHSPYARSHPRSFPNNEVYCQGGRPLFKDRTTEESPVHTKQSTPQMRPLKRDPDCENRSRVPSMGCSWEERRLLLAEREQRIFEAEEAMRHQEEEAQERLRIALEQQEMALNAREQALKQREAAVQKKLEQATRLMEESRKIVESKRSKDDKSILRFHLSGNDVQTNKPGFTLYFDNSSSLQNSSKNYTRSILNCSDSVSETQGGSNFAKECILECNESKKLYNSSAVTVSSQVPDNIRLRSEVLANSVSKPEINSTHGSVRYRTHSLPSDVPEGDQKTSVWDKCESAPSLDLKKVVRTYGRNSRCRTTSEMSASSLLAHTKASVPPRARSVAPDTQFSFNKSVPKVETSNEETVVNGGASVTITPLDPDNRPRSYTGLPSVEFSKACGVGDLEYDTESGLHSNQSENPTGSVTVASVELKPNEVSRLVLGDIPSKETQYPGPIRPVYPPKIINLKPVPPVDKSQPLVKDSFYKYEGTCLSEIQARGYTGVCTKERSFTQDVQTSSISSKRERSVEKQIQSSDSEEKKLSSSVNTLPAISIPGQEVKVTRPLEATRSETVKSDVSIYHSGKKLAVGARNVVSASTDISCQERQVNIGGSQLFIADSVVKEEPLCLTSKSQKSFVRNPVRQDLARGVFLPGDIFFTPESKSSQTGSSVQQSLTVTQPLQRSLISNQAIPSHHVVPEVKGTSPFLSHIPSSKSPSSLGNCKLTLVNQVTCHEAPLASNAVSIAYVPIGSTTTLSAQASSAEPISVVSTKPEMYMCSAVHASHKPLQDQSCSFVSQSLQHSLGTSVSVLPASQSGVSEYEQSSQMTDSKKTVLSNQQSVLLPVVSIHGSTQNVSSNVRHIAAPNQVSHKDLQHPIIVQDGQLGFLSDQPSSQKLSQLLPASNIISQGLHSTGDSIHSGLHVVHIGQESPSPSQGANPLQVFSVPQDRLLHVSEHGTACGPLWTPNNSSTPITEAVTTLGEFDPVSRTLTSNNPIFLQSVLGSSMNASADMVSVDKGDPHTPHSLCKSGKENVMQITFEIQADATNRSLDEQEQTEHRPLLDYHQDLGEDREETRSDTVREDSSEYGASQQSLDISVDQCDEVSCADNNACFENYRNNKSQKFNDTYADRGISLRAPYNKPDSHEKATSVRNVPVENEDHFFISTGIVGNHELTETRPAEENPYGEPAINEKSFSDSENDDLTEMNDVASHSDVEEADHYNTNNNSSQGVIAPNETERELRSEGITRSIHEMNTVEPQAPEERVTEFCHSETFPEVSDGKDNVSIIHNISSEGTVLHYGTQPPTSEPILIHELQNMSSGASVCVNEESQNTENEYILPNSCEYFDNRKHEILSDDNCADDTFVEMPARVSEVDPCSHIEVTPPGVQEEILAENKTENLSFRGRIKRRGRGRSRGREKVGSRGRGIMRKKLGISCTAFEATEDVASIDSAEMGCTFPLTTDGEKNDLCTERIAESEKYEHVSQSGRRLKLNSYLLKVVSRGSFKQSRGARKTKKDVIQDIENLTVKQPDVEERCLDPENNGSPISSKKQVSSKGKAAKRKKESKKSRDKIGGIGEAPQVIQCGKCEVTCCSLKKFITHAQHEHNGLARPADEGQEFTETERKAILAKTAKVIKKLKCEKCGKIFRSLGGYHYHIDICGNTKEGIFVTCTVCEKLIPMRGLRHHMKRWHSEGETCNVVNEPLELAEDDGSRPKRRAAKNCNAILEVWRSDPSEAMDDKLTSADKCYKGVRVGKLYSKDVIHIPPDLIKKWEADISSSQKSHCPHLECNYVIKSVKSGCAHYLRCSHSNIKRTYKCKVCAFMCSSSVEIKMHLTQNHEQSNECSGDSDSDSFDGDSELLDFVKKPQTGKIDHDQLKPFEPAFNWTFDFVIDNYSDLLFLQLEAFSEEWILLNANQAERFKPGITNSPKFRINSMKRQQNQCTDWKNLEAFDGISLSESYVLFAGGPIVASAWCPKPLKHSLNAKTQYLALSTAASPDRDYCVTKTFSHEGLIQIWGFTDLGAGDTSSTNFILGIAHNYGNVWSLAWCPSGIYQSESEYCASNTALRRLGLLAAACSDGTVRIFVIPHPSQLEVPDTSRIFSVNPKITLRSTMTQGEDAQCFKIDWFRGKGHQYIAGAFSTGFVCVWDLCNSSPLLQVMGPDGCILYPIHCFLAHNGVCSTVAFCSTSGGRNVITGGFDRTYKFWDLENVSMPINIIRKGLITDSIWLLHWAGSFVSFDDVYGLANTSTCYRDSGFYNIPSRNVLSSNASVWALSGSDWLNCLVQGDAAGEVVITVQQQLFKNYENDKVPAKRKVPVLAVRIEKLGEPLHVSSQDAEDLKTLKKVSEKGGKKTASQKGKSDSVEADGISPGAYFEVPRSYNEACQNYGIVFNDQDHTNFANIPQKELAQRKRSDAMEPGPVACYPLMSATSVSWNNNFGSHSWIFVGTQSGLCRVVNMKALRENQELFGSLSKKIAEIFPVKE